MNDHPDFAPNSPSGQMGYAIPLGTYTAQTFLWMFLGLLVTAVTAVAALLSGFLLTAIVAFPYFFIVLLVAEVAVVLFLSARIQKLSVGMARGLFFAYAVLNGVVFSTYFLMFEVFSLVLVFGMTSIYFGAMAAYGFFTKSDLSRLRPILISGLIFLLAFAVLSFFLPLAMFDRVICLIGIAVFLAFTAYDTQKIRAFHAMYANDYEMANKASIFSALQLYLDFVNLFLYLLRFLGKRK